MIIKHSVRTVRKPCSQCGSKELYWGHDSDGRIKPGAHYCREHDSSNWSLINRDGTAHVHEHGQPADEPEHGEPAGEPEPWIAEPAPTAPVTAPAATPKPASDDRMSALSALLDLLAPKVDAGQVHAIVDERLRGLVLPVRVEVTRNGETKPLEGITHPAITDVLDILIDGDHAMMIGPPGTGKSHIAEQCAEALGLPFYGVSLGPQTPTSQLLGYMQATGEYVRSLFRQAYEHGGLFHFDEFDAGNAQTMVVINAALANGQMAFPDRMVKRHDDFRCAASANTHGTGPDRMMVGRQQLDAATLDRFEEVEIQYDPALEESLCLASGLDAYRVKQILAHVRYLRKQASAYKLPISFGSRRARSLCKRLARGWDVEKAVKSAVRKGISDTDWRKVSEGAPRI